MNKRIKIILLLAISFLSIFFGSYEAQAVMVCPVCPSPISCPSLSFTTSNNEVFVTDLVDVYINGLGDDKYVTQFYDTSDGIFWFGGGGVWYSSTPFRFYTSSGGGGTGQISGSADEILFDCPITCVASTFCPISPVTVKVAIPIPFISPVTQTVGALGDSAYYDVGVDTDYSKTPPTVGLTVGKAGGSQALQLDIQGDAFGYQSTVYGSGVPYYTRWLAVYGAGGTLPGSNLIYARATYNSVNGNYNHEAYAQFNVVPVSAPDLITQNLARNPSGTINVGNAVTFSGIVRNNGDANAGASSARFCIDNANCLTNTTGRIGSDIAVPALNALTNSSTYTSAAWTATLGNHTIYWCADVGNAVAESDEGNNCSAISFSVAAVVPPPTNLSGSCPAPGTAANLSWTAPPGYTQFAVRINPAGWTWSPPPVVDTSVTGTTYNFNTAVPGTTYTWWVTTLGPGGTFSADAVSSFVCSAAASTVDIKANGSDSPAAIPYNTAATLSWTYSDATSCTITLPASITVPPSSGSGSVSTGNLTGPRTYTIACDPGAKNDSVTVSVQAQPKDLTLIKAGLGTVTSTSSPTQASQINCGTTCQTQTVTYPPGTIVTLNASAPAGRIFTGWGGDCSGRGACVVDMTSPRTVLANFAVDPNYKEF